MSSRKTRSADSNLNLLDYEYKEIETFQSTGKLKTGAYILGRIYHCSTKKGPWTLEDHCKHIGEELYYDWIDKNIYPKKLQNILQNNSSNYIISGSHTGRLPAKKINHIQRSG